MELQNLPTSSRSAIEKAVRDAMQKAITDAVPAARNTYTRVPDLKNQVNRQRLLGYKDATTGRASLRGLFILQDGLSGRNVPEICHSGTLKYLIRCLQSFYDFGDNDNSSDSILDAVLKAIDALYASSNLGYRNCRVQRAEIADGPLLDPFDRYFGTTDQPGHILDIEVEVRVN
jgi:hypothetical protein